MVYKSLSIINQFYIISTGNGGLDIANLNGPTEVNILSNTIWEKFYAYPGSTQYVKLSRMLEFVKDLYRFYSHGV